MRWKGEVYCLEIKKSECRENIEALAIAVTVIVFIECFVARSFLVKGSSMQPTFQDEERVLVEKLSYNFRLPRTGDVVVIIPPGAPNLKYIKRVIAGPNQSILIQNSKVYLDGRKLDEPYIKDKFMSDYPFTIIPNGCVFVMGDNRNNSLDSRDPSHKVGFVPLKNVVGKVKAVFWPISKIRLINNPRFLPASFSSRASF
jgi:signal peptidase I